MIYRVGSWTADGGGLRSWQARTTEIYADGGSILANPSPIGGTWAWVAVDYDGWMIHWEHGWFEPPLPSEGGRSFNERNEATAGNNQSEMLAALLGLRSVKALNSAWDGIVCTDSQLTLRRWTASYGLKGIPFEWRRAMGEIMRSPGNISSPAHWRLLDGHPTLSQIMEGKGKRGNPVSVHNKQCDELCREAGMLRKTDEVITLEPLDMRVSTL